MALDSSNLAVLKMLDLSVAFNSVDHYKYKYKCSISTAPLTPIVTTDQWRIT